MNSGKAEDIKRSAIESLMAEIDSACEDIFKYPNIENVILDRVKHIERGELWLTEDALKLAPLWARIALLEARIAQIRSTPAKSFLTNNG